MNETFGGDRPLSVDTAHRTSQPIRYSTAIWGGAVVAVILYYFRFIGHPDGMTVYPAAAACLMKGEPLVTCSPGFTYPPFFAFVMIPLTIFPLWGRNLVWYCVLVAATYGSFRICEGLTIRAFRIDESERPWLRLFSLVLSLKLILGVFENQAYDVLVFFFALVGLFGLTYEKTILAAMGFAVAAALKATPVLFFVYLLFLRKWKVLALSLMLCAMFSLLPDALFPQNDARAGYLRRWLVEVAGGGLFGTMETQFEVYSAFWVGGNHLNQSLRPFVYRILDGRTGKDFAGHSWIFLHLVYVMYAMAASAIAIRSTKVQGSYVWGGSVVLMSMVLLSPMSSKSHFVVLLLPYMAVVAYLLKHRDAWRPVLPLLIASFAFNTLTAKAIIGRELSTQMLFLGCITIGTLLLLAAVAVAVFRSLPDTQAPNGEGREVAPAAGLPP